MAKPKLRKNTNPGYQSTQVFNHLDSNAKNVKLVEANLKIIRDEQKQIINFASGNAHPVPDQLVLDAQLVEYADSVIKQNMNDMSLHVTLENVADNAQNKLTELNKLENEIDDNFSKAYYVALANLEDLENSNHANDSEVQEQIKELQAIVAEYDKKFERYEKIDVEIRDAKFQLDCANNSLERNELKCSNSNKQVKELKTDENYIAAADRVFKGENTYINTFDGADQFAQKHNDLSDAYLSGLKVRNNISNINQLTKDNEILVVEGNKMAEKISKLSTIDSYLTNQEFKEWQSHNYQCQTQTDIVDNYKKLLKVDDNENKSIFSNIASSIRLFFTKSHYEKKLHEAETKLEEYKLNKQKYEQDNVPNDGVSYVAKHNAIIDFFNLSKPGTEASCDQLHEMVSASIDGMSVVHNNIQDQLQKNNVSLEQQTEELNNNITNMSVNMINAGLQPMRLEDTKYVKVKPLPVENGQDAEANISQISENTVPTQILDATNSSPQMKHIHPTSDFSSFSEDDGMLVDDKDFNIESTEKFNREVAEHAKHTVELQKQQATITAANVASVKPAQGNGVSNDNNMDDGSITL